MQRLTNCFQDRFVEPLLVVVACGFVLYRCVRHRVVKLSRHTVTKFLTNSLARFHNRNEHPDQYQHQCHYHIVRQEIWHEEFGGRGRVSSPVVYQGDEACLSEMRLVSKHADSDTKDPDADRLIPNRIFRKFVYGAVQTEFESPASTIASN
jgi:hypothetical protein